MFSSFFVKFVPVMR